MRSVQKTWEALKNFNNNPHELANILYTNQFIPDGNGETCKYCKVTDSRIVVGSTCDFCLEMMDSGESCE